MSNDQRRAELGKIHIAAEALGMDTHDKDPESDYRRMLWTVARVHSAADLDAAGRRAVLEHLKACGFKPRPRPNRRPKPAAEKDSKVRKIYALLGRRPASYADGVLRQMYRDTAPRFFEWASEEQLLKLIAALEYDKRRNAQ